MITPDEFTASSFQVLGDTRVDKIRRINEEAARRMEAWSVKNQAEIQQRRQLAAAEVAEEQATNVEADVETGGVRTEAGTTPETETELEGDKTVTENSVATSTDVSA